MGYLKRIFNNCNEVSERSLKGQEESIGLKVRIEMFIHISFCKCCKNFVKQSHKMDTALEEWATQFNEKGPESQTSEDFKSKLKDKIKEL